MTCSFCGECPVDWIRQQDAVWVICPNCGAEYVDHYIISSNEEVEKEEVKDEVH